MIICKKSAIICVKMNFFKTLKMKILGIGGSPRKGGNSDILLGRALEGARSEGASVEKIILNDLDIKPCQECRGCDETGICVLEDDMKSVYEKMDEADGVIIASPIFFGSLSAQTKMMIDRFQCAWVRKYILKKKAPLAKKRKGLFLCVSAWNKKEFFENAKAIIKTFFITMDIDCFGEQYCPRVDAKASIVKNKEALDKAFDLGASLVRNLS